MKLSFAPGKLYLSTGEDGALHLSLDGEEIFCTRSQKAGISKFNAMRKEMESRFPPSESTPEQKAAAFRAMIGDALVGRNSLGGRKKKTSAGGTRTFGG
ncbi:MAG: hypothetical protein ACRD0Y_02615 [Terriglobales bacterium]